MNAALQRIPSHPGLRNLCRASDPRIGAVFDGRYALLERIGAGGMGVVYRASQMGVVAREVAIKVLNRRALEDPAVVRQFENEARIMAKLRHPNTLRLLDSGRTPEGDVYIVTELLDGEPLSERLRRDRIGTNEALEILIQIARSLSEAHNLGIVHCDLKPSNVFIEVLAGQEIVKVLDFGTARCIEGAGVAERAHSLGTPGYLAPEQASGEPGDARADIYSLGAIAYYCFTGQPAYMASTPLQLLWKQGTEDPPHLAAHTPESLRSRGVDALIMRMLSRNPDDRPPAMDFVCRELECAQRPAVDPLSFGRPAAL